MQTDLVLIMARNVCFPYTPEKNPWLLSTLPSQTGVVASFLTVVQILVGERKGAIDRNTWATGSFCSKMICWR